MIGLTTIATVSCVTNTTTEGGTQTMTSTSNQTTENTTDSTNQTTKEVVPVHIETVTIVNQEILVDDMLEIDLFEAVNNQLIKSNYNPYDYNEIEVMFTFTKPSGETLNHSAFWMREYQEVKVIGEAFDDEGFYTAGQELVVWNNDLQDHYRIRLTPDEVGSWDYTMQVRVLGNAIQTLTGNFQVSDSQERTKGVIAVDTTNNRNFIFQKSNTTYFANGLNLGWWSTTLSAHDYYNWFKELNENNGNMARIWLANWSFSLHKYSYENFDDRQNILARLDYLFETAKEFDIYIMLTLINHGQFSAQTNPEWSENPYNSKNGGMLDYPIQFFYNEEAITAYQNELRYLISRFGYSENIFAWELFNETDWIDGYSAQVVTRWKDKMATFLHENDPYNHLVTTSYKYTYGTPAFALDSLDFCTFHSYEYGSSMYYEKMVSDLTTLWDRYQKPVLFGEVGIDWQAGHSTYSSDYTGITIHQGMWAGLMSSGGGANQWWWDSWIDLHDLWYRYLGASTYATYMDVANQNYQLIQENTQVSTNKEDLKVMGYLLEDKIYGYVYNNMWNYWNASPDIITAGTVNIPFTNGTYTLRIFDTSTGEIISENQVTVTNNVFTLDNITITTDYAFILE